MSFRNDGRVDPVVAAPDQELRGLATLPCYMGALRSSTPFVFLGHRCLVPRGRPPVPVVRYDASVGPVLWRPASLPSFLDISHVSCLPRCFGSPIRYRTAFHRRHRREVFYLCALLKSQSITADGSEVSVASTV